MDRQRRSPRMDRTRCCRTTRDPPLETDHVSVHTAQRKQRSLDFCKSRSIFSHPEGVKDPNCREGGSARVNLALTEDQQLVRQTFSTLFSKEADPARVRAA